MDLKQLGIVPFLKTMVYALLMLIIYHNLQIVCNPASSLTNIPPSSQESDQQPLAQSVLSHPRSSTPHCPPVPQNEARWHASRRLPLAHAAVVSTCFTHVSASWCLAHFIINVLACLIMNPHFSNTRTLSSSPPALCPPLPTSLAAL